jgi:thiol-disulfide isomerase/thioredoxin
MNRSFVLVLLTAIIFSGCSITGKNAPEFSFETLEGNHLTSSELKGKTIVVNVWATWCGMCIREIPDLNRLQAKYANDSTVVFLALCDDEAAKVKQVLSRVDFNYIQVADAAHYTSKIKTRMVKTYPQNIIIDEDFNVIFEVTEAESDIYALLDEEIQRLKKS